MVDEGQFSQVIHNLLFNADQAMPEGGEITIRGEKVTLAAGEHPALAAGDYVAVTVEDRGTGIRKEHLKAIVSSGYSRDPVMSDFRAYGSKAAVRKPYVISEMNQAVQAVVEGR
jgi:signal transduction histidine kinase